jgi:hypothetical protein
MITSDSDAARKEGRIYLQIWAGTGIKLKTTLILH